MANKRRTKQPAKLITGDFRDSVDLRKWCVELAARWPAYSYGGHGASHGLGPSYNPLGSHGLGPSYNPPGSVNADVIGRAQKILSWVLIAPE